MRDYREVATRLRAICQGERFDGNLFSRVIRKL